MRVAVNKLCDVVCVHVRYWVPVVIRTALVVGINGVSVSKVFPRIHHTRVCMVSALMRVCMYLCAHVCERERERKSARVCVCMCVRKREIASKREREGERDRHRES